MTCRCTTTAEHQARYESQQAYYRQEEEKKKAAARPNPDDYEIIQFERVGPHLVLKVKYPSCKQCEYEGNKVMVFLHVSEMQTILWKRIDPHFRAPSTLSTSRDAPSPAARFPPTKEGWADAITYAKGKTRGE